MDRYIMNLRNNKKRLKRVTTQPEDNPDYKSVLDNKLTKLHFTKDIRVVPLIPPIDTVNFTQTISSLEDQHTARLKRIVDKYISKK